MNYSQVATHPLQATGHVASTAQRNRVLRNTYWLLALSMLPTVVGAWIGVATGLFDAMTLGISLMIFLGGTFGIMMLLGVFGGHED